MKVPVLIPRIFNYPLTYNYNFDNFPVEGEFVIVPFGKNEEVGVIWDKIQPTSKKIKIRNIKKKIKNIEISKKLIKFINWFSMYNLTSKGMVLKMCLGNKTNILAKEDEKEEKKYNKKKYILNPEQSRSLNNLKSFGKDFNVSVLQGLTGSGKTLVYFERVKQILAQKKQVLILLPEIFLTNQFNERFLDFFGFKPAIWHSKVTTKNKKKIWHEVIKNEIKIVIGARSSLFLPFKDLGLVIVDEEHDPSYKQDEGLIYNARDMAIARASIENFPIVLVSSIPSLETFNHIKNKKYKHTKIIKRFNDYPLPEAKIINLNLENMKNEYISKETIKIVNKYLEKN